MSLEVVFMPYFAISSCILIVNYNIYYIVRYYHPSFPITKHTCYTIEKSFAVVIILLVLAQLEQGVIGWSNSSTAL